VLLYKQGQNKVNSNLRASVYRRQINKYDSRTSKESTWAQGTSKKSTWAQGTSNTRKTACSS
jgi:hypothetical protein